MLDVLDRLVRQSGFVDLFQLMEIDIFGLSLYVPGYLIMLCLACLLIYLAIYKEYEPYLLIPIAMGVLLANLPSAGLMDEGGLLYWLYKGTALGIYPPLIFLCIGVGTDFGPLIANPKSLLLGAAAQIGIFFTFIIAGYLGFTPQEMASIAIIGGADGPTALLVTAKLAAELLGPIAIAAYSYMALVPIIQPPIMKLMTTKEERNVVMKQLRTVSQRERIIFPIFVTIFVSLLIPSAASLIGMLMLGNLIRESNVVPNLVTTLETNLMYIVSIVLGLTVGATANAVSFLNTKTLLIIGLGLVAFAIGTASGVLFGKIMYRLDGKTTNPLIGAAGVSAVPMAARVAQKVGQESNPSNFLLMHAMGPNVAGVIGSAIAAGLLLAFFGG